MLREKYRRERDARLPPDGNNQHIEVKGDFSHYTDDPYVEPGFIFDELYGAGPVAFYDLMRAWRAQGELAGLSMD
jgi:hypothetical protein